MIWPPGMGFHQLRCSRKGGHGPDGEYCKQHDPVRKQKEKDIKKNLL